jgi:hypothetical protein
LRDFLCVKNKASSKRLHYVIPFDIAHPNHRTHSSIGVNYLLEKEDS